MARKTAQRKRVESPGPPDPNQGIRIDPTKYTAPVVLNVLEIQVLGKMLSEMPLSGTPDQLEGVLGAVKSIRGKLLLANQVIQQKLPKPPKVKKG